MPFLKKKEREKTFEIQLHKLKPSWLQTQGNFKYMITITLCQGKLFLSSLLVVSSIISEVNYVVSLGRYADQTGWERIGVGRGVKVLIVTEPVDVDKVACQVLAVRQPPGVRGVSFH